MAIPFVKKLREKNPSQPVLQRNNNEKAIVGGIEDYLSNIEKSIYSSIGAIFYGNNNASGFDNFKSLLKPYKIAENIAKTSDAINQFINELKGDKIQFTVKNESLDTIKSNLSELKDLFKAPVKETENISTNIVENTVDINGIQKEIEETKEAINQITYPEFNWSMLEQSLSKIIFPIRFSEEQEIVSYKEDLAKIIEKLEREPDFQGNLDTVQIMIDNVNSKNITKILEALSKVEGTSSENLAKLGKALELISSIDVSNLDVFADKVTYFSYIDTRRLSSTMQEIEELVNAEMTNFIDSLGQIKHLNKPILNNLDNIESAFSKFEEISGIKINVNRIKTNLNKLKKILGNEKEKGLLKSILESTNELPKLSKKATSNFDELSKFFVALSVCGNIDYKELVKSLKQLPTIFNDIYEVLDNNDSEKIRIGADKIIAQLDYLNNVLFQKIEMTAKGAEAQQENIKKINDLLEQSNEIALKGNSIDGEALKDSDENISEMLGVIADLGLVMIIGGWIFEKNQKLVMSSLRFGAVLGIFLMELMIPIGLLGLIGKYAEANTEAFKSLTNFIVYASAILALCGLVFLIPNIDIAASTFGIIFSQFLLSLLIPIGLLGLIGKSDVLESLEKTAKFVDDAALIMTLGSAIMLIGNGIIYKNALKFGKTLGLFILEVIAPFILYGILVRNAIDTAEEIATLITTCAIIMSIGSLFMRLGGGRYVKDALKFGATLMVFMWLVLLPVMKLKKFVEDASNTINSIIKFITTCALIMIVGALFAERDQFIKNAFKFTALFHVFILSIILPLSVAAVFLLPLFFTLNKIKKFIIVATAVMLLGAYIMIKEPEMAIGALAFTGLLALFIFLILKPFKGINVQIATAYKTILSIAVLILAISVSLYLMTMLVDKYKWKPVLGLLLVGAVILGTWGILRLLADPKANSDLKIGLKNAFLVAALFLVTGGIIALINIMLPDKGILAATAKVGLVLGTMAVMVLLVKFINSQIKDVDIKKALVVVGSLSLMLLVIAGALAIVAASGVTWKHFGILTLTLLVVALLAGGIMWLNKTLKPKDLKDATILLVGCAGVLLVISAALYIIAKSDVTWKHFGILALSLLIVGLVAGAILWINSNMNAKTVKESALIILACGTVLLLISKSIDMISKSNAEWKHVEMLGVMSAVVMAMAYLIKTIAKNPMMNKANMAVATLVLAASAGILIGLSYAVKLIAESKADWKHVGMLAVMSALLVGLTGIATLLGTVGATALPMIAIGEAVLAGITLIMLGLAETLRVFAEASTLLEKIEDPGKIKNNITTIFAAFTDLKISDIRGTLKSARAMSKILKALTPPLRDAAILIGDLSNLKVAISWDEKGNVTMYRHLTESDFSKASGGIAIMMATLAEGVDKAEGFIGNISNRKLEKVLKFSQKVSKVVSALGSSIKNIALMRIPTEYNDEGKPINYRQLEPKDFENAATAISTIILTVGGTIAKIAAGGNESININGYRLTFEEFKEAILGNNRNFNKVLKASSKLGTLIRNIASGISLFAQMKMPTGYDSNGKPTGYEKMGKEELSLAASNIAMVLTSLVGAVALTYEQNKDLFDIEITRTGLFGMIKKQNPSKIERALSLSLEIGSIIKSISEGISSMASMRFVSEYDSNGNPLKYVTLKDTDLTGAINNIKTVLTTMAKGIAEAYAEIGPTSSFNLQDKIAAFVPIGTLIKETAEGLLAYSKLEEPIYDKDGKIIDYKKFPKDFIEQGKVKIIEILTTSAKALNEAYTKIDKNPQKLKLMFEAFTPVTALIKSMAESIQVFANGGIPIYENGNITGYVPFKQTDIDLYNDFVNSILTTSFETVFSIYNDERYKGVFFGKGNVFDEIFEKIQKPFELIKNVANLIKSLSEMKIVEGFNGKEITGYKQLDVNVITDAETVIKTLLTSIPQAIIDAYESIKSSDFVAFDSMNEILAASSVVLETLFTSFVPNIVNNFDLIQQVLPMIDTAETVLTKLSSIFAVQDTEHRGTFYGFINKSLGNNLDTMSIKRKIMDFSEAMKILTEMSLVTAGAQSDGFDIIANGYEKMNKQLNDTSVEKINKFQKQTEILERYVKVINTLNTSKIDRLNGLLESMEKLAAKIGNIDKFTETLTEKLAETLAQLSENIESAEKTIKTADRIQKERQENIGKAIEEIKTIMKVPLKVGVKNLGDDETIESVWETPKGK